MSADSDLTTTLNDANATGRGGNVQTRPHRCNMATRPTHYYCHLILLLLVAIIYNVSCQESDPSRNYQLPQHDGKKRLVDLKESNFERVKKNAEILVVYFEMPHYGREDGKRSSKFMREMLEVPLIYRSSCIRKEKVTTVTAILKVILPC